MEAIRREQIEITLKLTKEEAKWLKEIMQNPISHQQIEGGEREEDNVMRNQFWNVLTKAGVQLY